MKLDQAYSPIVVWHILKHEAWPSLFSHCRVIHPRTWSLIMLILIMVDKSKNMILQKLQKLISSHDSYSNLKATSCFIKFSWVLCTYILSNCIKVLCFCILWHFWWQIVAKTSFYHDSFLPLYGKTSATLTGHLKATVKQ